MHSFWGCLWASHTHYTSQFTIFLLCFHSSTYAAFTPLAMCIKNDRERERGEKYSINFNIDGNACDNRNNKARSLCQHAIIFSAWLYSRRLMSPFCAVLISCSASQQCNNSHIFAYIFIIFCPLSLFHSLSLTLLSSVSYRGELFIFSLLVPSRQIIIII